MANQGQNQSPQNPLPAAVIQGERFGDVFTEIAKKFSSIKHFREFAQAGNGLSLSISDITTIIEDNPNSVQDQKRGMFSLWRENNGQRATPRLLRETVQRYFNQGRPGGPKIEDAFLEVPKRFYKAVQFEQFALSSRGLSLSINEVQNIKENSKSVEERNHEMLILWKMKNGDAATVVKIWKLVNEFLGGLGGSREGPRIEDAFLEVPKKFHNAGLFKQFALSSQGLSLSINEVENIKENSKFVEERNHEMLILWKMKNGDAGTVVKIWQLVNGFLGGLGGSREAPSGSGLQSTSRSRHYEAPDMPDQAPSGSGSQSTSRSDQVSLMPTQADLSGANIEGNVYISSTVQQHYYGSQDSEGSGQQTAGSGLNIADKLQQFGKVLEDSTRKSSKPTIMDMEELAAHKIEVNPDTVVVNYYKDTIEDPEYKPEPGFSQHTSKQPGEPISMENFFSDGKSRVAIIGGAGYGKTEMLKRYITAVLDGKIPELKEVKFVLHLNFRDLDVEGKMTLGQFLFGHLDVSDDVIEAGLDHIKENAKIFLLAIDGADQYAATEHLGKPNKIENHKKPADPKLLLNSILSAKLLDGIHVIYTSREHVFRYFKGEVRPEKIIALAGFDEKSVEELIRGLSGDQADDIMHHLETKAPSLLSLCSVPMFLVFTVFVLRAYKDTHNPETLTEVLLLVFDNAMKSDHISEDRRKIIHEVLHQLKGVLFNCTRARKVTFTNQDLPAAVNPDDFKDLLIPIPGKKGVNRTLIEKDFVYLPIHQSLQEALAALNIAEMNDIKEFEEFVSKEIHEPHWVVVRRILYGILMNNKSYNIAVGTGTGIMKEVPEDLLKKKRWILLSSLKERIRSTEEGEKRDYLELIHLINECGDVDADVTSSIRLIDFYGMPLTQSDKYAVASVLGRCSRLDLLIMSGMDLTASDLSLLASSMQRSDIKIRKMGLGGGMDLGELDFLTDDESAAICNMLPHITEYMLLNYRVEPEDVQMIQRKLDSLPPTELKVQYWDLEGEPQLMQQRRSK